MSVLALGAAAQAEGTSAQGAMRSGYCYFDCSRCETDQDFPLCVQAPPAPSPQ